MQPIVEALREPGKMGNLALAAVKIFSVTYVLSGAVFLLIYFLGLWLLLKWDSQRRVDRWLGCRGKTKNQDPSLDLNCQAIEWMDELTLPISTRSQRLADLIGRINSVKGER